MSVRVICADAIAGLRELPADSVHCVVTSPPYWGLRDYGVEGQIGLEPTPDAWTSRLVEVFREVKRVLRPDGVCFVNLGDSYATGGYSPRADGRVFSDGRSTWGAREQGGARTAGVGGLKPKDLVGQPWLFAFALRADGWWLRSEIVWAKPNPMPESVTDRPTKAHETVFLLTKSARYFYDAEAVREVNSNPDLTECVKHWTERPGNGEWPSGTGGRMGSVQNGRNLRSVWTIATEPFPESHFAVFPRELARRCILAGTSAKGCCSAKVKKLRLRSDLSPERLDRAAAFLKRKGLV